MPYARARSSRHVDDQIVLPCSTASGQTELTRMPDAPPSSARQRARCSSAAFAAEYAAAFFPAAMLFFEATKTSDPPVPCAFHVWNAARETRKYPVASTPMLRCHSAIVVSSMGAEE